MLNNRSASLNYVMNLSINKIYQKDRKVMNVILAT